MLDKVVYLLFTSSASQFCLWMGKYDIWW